MGEHGNYNTPLQQTIDCGHFEGTHTILLTQVKESASTYTHANVLKPSKHLFMVIYPRELACSVWLLSEDVLAIATSQSICIFPSL